MNTFLVFFCVAAHIGGTFASISATKCEEYGKAVYTQKFSPAMTRIAKSETVSECGIVSVPLIIGGEKAKEKEFPHMAAVGFGSSPTSAIFWECGGALISDLYVLTAAHCLNSRENGPAQKVRMGTLNLENPGQELVEKTIVERIPHSQYSALTKQNDIALLKLDSLVTFSGHVRPACLNPTKVNSGIKAFAAGFGKTAYDATKGSPDLMKVTLDILSFEECKKNLAGGPRAPKLTDSMLCAGFMKGGKDTCQGDSGGPLQTVLEKPYCMYNLVGVTSFGKFCGFANSPAVYSDVASYIPWIESIVWK